MNGQVACAAAMEEYKKWVDMWNYTVDPITNAKVLNVHVDANGDLTEHSWWHTPFDNYEMDQKGVPKPSTWGNSMAFFHSADNTGGVKLPVREKKAFFRAVEMHIKSIQCLLPENDKRRQAFDNALHRMRINAEIYFFTSKRSRAPTPEPERKAEVVDVDVVPSTASEVVHL